MKEVLLSEDELRALCKEWQKRLRLQDWIVEVEICRGRNMSLKEVSGECEWILQNKMASIRILDPMDYPDDLILPYDMEKTLVHELLHLHFAPIYANTDDKSIDDAQEQAIDCIAMALVNFKRND